jgi:hypothetical protein
LNNSKEKEMNIKKKSKRAPIALLILAVVLAMSLGGLTTAFAAPSYTDYDETQEDPTGYLHGTSKDNPAEAAITKILKTPKGTTLPTLKYTFNFVSISVDGKTEETAPKIDTDNKVEIIFNEESKEGDYATSEGAILILPQESGHLFGSITWPHAGQYVYEVTETQEVADYGYDATTSKYIDTLEFSQAKYLITVGVAADTDGTLYVADISTERTVTDVLEDGEAASEKVNPTPGDVTTTVEGDYSGLKFTNTYVRTKKGDTPTDESDSTLDVSKTVGGTYGSKTIYFDFDITVTQPSIAPADVTTYKAYVISGGAVATTASNGAIIEDNGGNYLSFTTGTRQTIHLKHGQTLRFVGLPVGTSYYVNEQDTPAYTPKVTVTYNGGTANADNGGTVNDLGGGTNDKDKALATGEQLIGESANSAAYLNNNSTTAPTGIDLNTIPFIGLIVLAVAALVAYTVVKSRRRRRSGGY